MATLYGVSAGGSQAHGNEGQWEDEHHHTQHTADDQAQHVTAPGGAGGRAHVLHSPEESRRGAQVFDGLPVAPGTRLLLVEK